MRQSIPDSHFEGVLRFSSIIGKFFWEGGGVSSVGASHGLSYSPQILKMFVDKKKKKIIGT